MKKIIFLGSTLLCICAGLIVNANPPHTQCVLGTTGYCTEIWDANGFAHYECKEPEGSAVVKDCPLSVD